MRMPVAAVFRKPRRRLSFSGMTNLLLSVMVAAGTRLGPRFGPLEADLQTCSSGNRQAFQGLRGRSRPAALQTRNHRLGRRHTLGELLLGEAGRDARVNHGAGKLELRRNSPSV